MIVIYDGSFEEFLTLVYEVYYLKLKVERIQKNKHLGLFDEELFEVEFDQQKSDKVLHALQSNFTKQNFETILNIFMCDSIEFELHLLSFVILGFKDQKELDNINHQCVFFLKSLQSELFKVVHKMTGFLRFEELEDQTLYARLESKFNLVYFLGRHFKKRLNNQNFIIHDINRKLVFGYNDSFVGVKTISNIELPKLSKDELKFQKLWKIFFKSVSIESRANEKLQKQWVPLIYRVYMSEFH